MCCFSSWWGLMALLVLLPVQKTELSSEEKAIVTRTNQERSKAKLPPLKIQPQLCQAAQAHARNMAKLQQLEHVIEGQNAGDRVKKTGYPFADWGENICRGQKTAAEAVTDWMESPKHRTNILADNFTEIGVGIAVDARKRKYYVQVFGTPKQ
jgi:uncharacterized protein YkwD